MRSTHGFTVSVTLLACLVAAPLASWASPQTSCLLPHVLSMAVSSDNLVSEKRPVPEDPLAGLPGDDNDRGKQRNRSPREPNKQSACAVKAGAADERNLGDLRATLAYVKLGPKTVPCAAHGATPEARLRISIDGDGKITKIQPVAAEADAIAAIVRKMEGKAITPSSSGATVGTVVLKFPARR